MNIYLDTNIFSRLKPQEQLNNYYHTVKKHSCTNCYFYSRAHIYDLLNDKTDTKYQDLSLISEITKNRYLVKALPNPVKIYNQAPLSAFNYELSELDNKVDLSEFENSPKLKSIIDNLKNTLASIDVPEMDLSLFPTETRKYINNILEQKNNFDFHKLVQNGLSYENTLYTNTTEYKSLRSLLMSYKNQIFTKSNASISIDNINSIFENSTFSMNFISFINKQITVPILNEYEKLYHQYITAYNVLNSMGLDSEINKKAKFRNTFNDSLHTYYASFCDFFITDDQGVIEKSNVIYKTFNAKTAVLSSEVFLNKIEKKFLTTASTRTKQLLEK